MPALQHDDAAFDRLQRRCRRDTRQRAHGVDLVPDFAFGHAGPPLIARLEHDVGFDHAGGSGIECRLRAADLAEHVGHFRDLLDHRVLRLQHFHRLVETCRRIEAGHVEPAAFVQRDPVVGLQAGENVLGFDIAGHFVQLGAQHARGLLHRTQHGRQAESRPQPQDEHDQAGTTA